MTANPLINTNWRDKSKPVVYIKRLGLPAHTNCNETIASWAISKPLVSRVWLFGSRVRGEHTLDSDLDIAVEIDKSAIQGIDYSGGFATWCSMETEWREELTCAIGAKIDLQYYREGETPTIQAGLDHSSILIYKKATC